MKTLYLECNMGAAGDMLMAALTELMPDKDAFVKELNDLQIPQVNIERTTIAKCGIMGTHMVVTVNGEEEKSIDVPMHAHTHSHVHEEHEHTHEHHHEHDENCTCGCHDHEHHHEHEHEQEHEHHHEHDHEHDHEHGHECDDPNCACHHHHHADEVFTSWGRETPKAFTQAKIQQILTALDSGDYGKILRAKGIVAGENGAWIEFDYVPEEHEVREGHPDYTGRLCVIGAELKEAALAELFGL